MEDKEKYFLGIDGIPMTVAPKDGKEYIKFYPKGAWAFSDLEVYMKADTQYKLLEEYITVRIWGSYNNFIEGSRSLPEDWRNALDSTGLNSSSAISHQQFSKMMRDIGNSESKEVYYKYLYTMDVLWLLTNIQEVNQELVYLSGDFYYILNFDSYEKYCDSESNGEISSYSPLASRAWAIISLIYIKLHCLLDYNLKLAWELENIKDDFNEYKKLSSSNKMYGKKSKLKYKYGELTLFNKDLFIKNIESYRNELVHNGLIDDGPVIRKRFENEKIVERYVLIPDTNKDGILESFGSRKFFYSKRVKFNLILPKLLKDFQERQINTLKILADNLILTNSNI